MLYNINSEDINKRMRQNCRDGIAKLIKNIKNLQQNRGCTEAMLIVDETTASALSSVVYYFFPLGVKNITKINLKKKPQPKCLGIYFLSPKSLSLISEDFKKQATYHSINLLVNQEISPDQLKQFVSNTKVIQRLAFFGQLRLNLKFLDDNVGIICEQFSLFKQIIKNEHKKHAQAFANSIFQYVISCYGQSTFIKIYYQNNQFFSELIQHLSNKHKEYQNQNTVKSSSILTADSKQKKVISLLLVDRKIDIISPIVRNFYYFSMISDFYNIDYTNRKILLNQEKTIELNLQDPIFNQYKNRHISKAQQNIEPDFKKFKTENKAAQLNKQKNLENISMKNLIRDIPEYNKKILSYESQIQIMYGISGKSKIENIPQIGQLQQLIVSGISGHGQEQIKDKKIYQRAMEYCSKITNQDYVNKIYCLILFCIDLSESDKKNIIAKIKQNLKYSNLGNSLESNLSLLMAKPSKLRPMFKKQKIFLDLHQCLLSTIICELTEKGSSKHVNFASIGEEPLNLESKFQKISKKPERQWLICMLGGLSINEICQIQRLKEVYQGAKMNFLTDKVYNSWGFLQQLGTIS